MKLRNIKFTDLIIHEDDDYIIVNKPPHLASLDDRQDSVNLKLLSKGYCETAQINHRLDKETSGILVIAKNPEAYRHFSIALQERKIEKIYHAIAWGRHNFNEMLVEAPLDIKSNGKVTVSKTGKYSATIFKSLEIYNTVTLIQCKLITGRKHQIRIHLASGGASIINDEKYNGANLFLSDLKKKYKPKDEQEEVPLMDRFALHSYSLKFTHINGKELYIEAPYPKDFERVIKQLNKWG